MSRTNADVLRAAALAAREKPARNLRPDWWVHTYGAGLTRPAWGRVTTVTQNTDQHGHPQVLLVLAEHRTGDRIEVTAPPGMPASCLNPATAARVGLT